MLLLHDYQWWGLNATFFTQLNASA